MDRKQYTVAVWCITYNQKNLLRMLLMDLLCKRQISRLS